MAKLRFRGDQPHILRLRPPGRPVTDITVKPDDLVELDDQDYLAHSWAASLWDEVDVPARPDVYDPKDHTVEEVLAYLADADDAERERVLAEEAAGKGRAGIAKFGEENV